MVDKEIMDEIESVYGNSSKQIITWFENYAKGEEWISHKNVFRAILKLSKGDALKVDKFLNMAKVDPRDVIMIADEIKD